MATVADRIGRALRLLSEIESGEDPTDDELADGLVALNGMLDSWRNDNLLAYAKQQETVTLSASDSSYTLGPSGDLVTTRPVAVLEAWIRDNGIDYPVTIINEADYAAISDKTTQSNWPDTLLFRPTFPNATVIVYPVPDATRSLILVTQVVVGQYTATTDTVTLPPGWEAAIDFNLAIELAPEYQATPSPAVIRRAQETLAGIKRANIQAQPRAVATELFSLFDRRSGNILSGDA